MYALSLFRRKLMTRLARQRVDEETSAHADLTMNAPHGQMDSAGFQRLAPGEHVLINAVDECAIEIEEEGLSRHSSAFSHMFILGLAAKRHKMHINSKPLLIYACAITCALVLMLAVSGATAQNARPLTPILFDNFSYSNKEQLKKNGWIVRTAPGWPGVPGAKWLDTNVTLLKDPANAKNRILRLTSSTDGTPENTTQTQICHQRKYREGTYAARIRFSDTPISGPDGDQLVQAFYAISPLKAPMDLDYSESDWEYLPNGGWGENGPSLYATTWETFSPEPNWKKDNVFKITVAPQGGWHTLVTQVSGGKVTYFLDGKLFVEHGGEYYPEDTMSLNFNLWFIRDGLLKVKEIRKYQQDIDWAFFVEGAAWTPQNVEEVVADLRRQSIKFVDRVRPKTPPLESPCNL